MREMMGNARWRRTLIAPAVLAFMGAMPLSAPLSAQEPVARAHLDPTEVEVGEPFQLIVETSGVGAVEDVALPPLWFATVPREGALPVATEIATEGAPSRGVFTFTYSFVARLVGSQDVGSVRVTADGQRLQTEPLTLLVTVPEGADEVEPAPELEFARVYRQPGWPDLSDAPDSILARASLNTEEAWVGAGFALVVEVFGVSEMDGDPVLPDMSGFAERTSRAGGGTSIGGRYESVHRTYHFRALAKGEFEIGAVRVTVAGRTLLTEPITLKVGESPPEPVRSPEDLRAIATADKRRVYVGESVIVSYDVLARDGRGSSFGGWSINRTDTVVFPPLENVRVERLPTVRFPSQLGLVEGRSYRHASEHRVAFFPLQPGETTIPPALVRVQVHHRSGRFEDTQAEQQGSWTPMTLVTDAIPLEVVALPADGRPTSFQGHVGTLDVASWVDRTSMIVGDTVTLRVEVSGDWVRPGMPHPEIVFPAGFAVSDPEIEHEIPRTGDRVSGTRLYVYRLVANREGSFRIPSVAVSWFNPGAESYGTSGSEPFDLTVVSTGRE